MDLVGPQGNVKSIGIVLSISDEPKDGLRQSSKDDKQSDPSVGQRGEGILGELSTRSEDAKDESNQDEDDSSGHRGNMQLEPPLYESSAPKQTLYSTCVAMSKSSDEDSGSCKEGPSQNHHDRMSHEEGGGVSDKTSSV